MEFVELFSIVKEQFFFLLSLHSKIIFSFLKNRNTQLFYQEYFTPPEGMTHSQDLFYIKR